MPIDARGFEVAAGVRAGGPGGFFLIAGPCVIESEKHAVSMARTIRDVCVRNGVPLIFKASFDKANRSSAASFRGPGLEKGLETLAAVKKEVGIPVLSDIHEAWQAEKAARVLDVIQIPAFLCRQTDLLMAAAATGRAVNIKKGQFLSPEEMRLALDKATGTGNHKVMLTERGTFFGYHNLVVDARSIPVMKAWGYPVIMDASHSVQRPAGEGARSGGDAEFIPLMARVGIVAGADGVFIEVHDRPEEALSDRGNSLRLSGLEMLVASLVRLKGASGGEAA
ncbi:MAG: 3-deoxy-8-phosphooctulonate synthase [Candidatus Aminicenantes bacterium]|nr:3-deoxy-8-phosphooctulonate synthase [Candidatus Aminicenantes bacterium]